MRREFLVRVDETDGHYRRLPLPGKHAHSIWRVAQKRSPIRIGLTWYAPVNTDDFTAKTQSVLLF